MLEGHDVQVGDPDPENFPGVQATQVLLEVAPRALDDVPAGQLVHEVDVGLAR